VCACGRRAALESRRNRRLSISGRTCKAAHRGSRRLSRVDSPSESTGKYGEKEAEAEAEAEAEGAKERDASRASSALFASKQACAGLGATRSWRPLLTSPPFIFPPIHPPIRPSTFPMPLSLLGALRRPSAGGAIARASGV
jgi:hypothetical protein